MREIYPLADNQLNIYDVYLFKLAESNHHCIADAAL